LDRNQTYVAIANGRGWPSERFSARVSEAQRAIAYRDKMRERDEALRNSYNRAGEVPEVQPPGTRHFNIQLNTSDGYAYGQIAIFPPQDGTFGDLEPLIRNRLRDIFEVPARPMRYLFAGRMYGRNTRFADVPTLRDDVTIFIVFQ
jgi:hypothetical protein